MAGAEHGDCRAPTATVSDFTVTIAAGTLSQTATFDLTPTDDDVDEGYESVAVSGTSTVSALSSVIRHRGEYPRRR